MLCHYFVCGSGAKSCEARSCWSSHNPKRYKQVMTRSVGSSVCELNLKPINMTTSCLCQIIKTLTIQKAVNDSHRPSSGSRRWAWLGVASWCWGPRPRLCVLIVRSHPSLGRPSCLAQTLLKRLFAIFHCGRGAVLQLVQLLVVAFSRHSGRRGARRVSVLQLPVSPAGCDAIWTPIVQIHITYRYTLQHRFTLNHIRCHKFLRSRVRGIIINVPVY